MTADDRREVRACFEHLSDPQDIPADAKDVDSDVVVLNGLESLVLADPDAMHRRVQRLVARRVRCLSVGTDVLRREVLGVEESQNSDAQFVSPRIAECTLVARPV
eukprot:Amastigsp_a680961_10.p4 type:complete len:105 gc:universal Amastigsp_a680961_10:429-743(+)